MTREPMKEKLIELIENAESQRLSVALCCTTDELIDLPSKEEYIADHLIAHSVTVQEWISVKDRLPEEEGWYLVYTTPNREHKSINKAMFCKGYAWGNFEPYWRGAGGHWANVTHWMPLPEPPKGE